MSLFNVQLDCQPAPKCRFIRVVPNDLNSALSDIVGILQDTSWISKFDSAYSSKRRGFATRTKETVEYILNQIANGSMDGVTTNSGELLVAEISRQVLIQLLTYKNIPLAELIKSQAYGNDGFDIYSENHSPIALFGEAKYLDKKNAYGRAFSQIIDFINLEQDTSDLVDMDEFFSPEALKAFDEGKKGFIAAFSCHTTPNQTLISNIPKNPNFETLTSYDELVLIGINLWTT